MYRTMTKTVSDFTGSPSTRLPNVLGGSYWFCNLLASQASVFVAVHLYVCASCERAQTMYNPFVC
jgi:hypothetical protein